MKRESQSLKKISNFIEVNGIGTVRMEDNSLRDVFVYGYFKMFHWWFIVHQDVNDLEYMVVSEASSGAILTDYCYPTVENALRAALPIIEEKRFYFSTSVGDILVKYGSNLMRRNISLQTLSVDIALWS